MWGKKKSGSSTIYKKFIYSKSEIMLEDFHDLVGMEIADWSSNYWYTITLELLKVLSKDSNIIKDMLKIILDSQYVKYDPWNNSLIIISDNLKFHVRFFFRLYTSVDNYDERIKLIERYILKRMMKVFTLVDVNHPLNKNLRKPGYKNFILQFNL
jgi:hypothetical protein